MASQSEGFSLVELLVVMAIISIVSVVSWPYIRGTADPDPALAAGEKLMQSFQAAQIEARLTNRPTSVIIDMNDRSVTQAGDGSRYVLPPEIAIKSVSTRSRSGARTAEFIFLPTGETSGGSVSLVAPRRNVVVSLRWLTGAIQMESQVTQ